MKKIIVGILVSILVGLFAVPTVVMAQDDKDDGFLDERTIDVLQEFGEETGLNPFIPGTQPVEGEEGTGINTITSVINTIIGILKFVVGGLAVIFLVITLAQLIAAGDNSEEIYEKAKKQFVYLIVAIVVVISADFFVNNVLFLGDGGFLASREAARQAATAGASEIRGIYNVIQAIVGSIAVLMLVIGGFRMVANAGNEEVQSKMKNQIIYAALGLIVVGVSELVVKDILFAEAGTTLGVERGKQLIVSITNFASGFIATLAVVSLLYAGYLYVVSGVSQDNTDKVKKIIIGAVIALLIAGGAFAIVNTVIELDPERAPDILQNQVDRIE